MGGRDLVRCRGGEFREPAEIVVIVRGVLITAAETATHTRAHHDHHSAASSYGNHQIEHPKINRTAENILLVQKLMADIRVLKYLSDLFD